MDSEMADTLAVAPCILGHGEVASANADPDQRRTYSVNGVEEFRKEAGSVGLGHFEKVVAASLGDCKTETVNALIAVFCESHNIGRHRRSLAELDCRFGKKLRLVSRRYISLGTLGLDYWLNRRRIVRLGILRNFVAASTACQSKDCRYDE